jgi:transcriptional regulator with XRE-family HTH domain
MSSYLENFIADPDGLRLFQQERLILDVTTRLCTLMDVQGVSRTELARRLGVSKAHVTRLLEGSRNMTLRTVSDLFTALGQTVELKDAAPTPAAKPKQQARPVAGAPRKVAR